jgi:hypothetical protein
MGLHVYAKAPACSRSEKKDKWQTGSATPRELTFYSFLEFGQFISAKNLGRIHSADFLGAREGYSAFWIVYARKFIKTFNPGTNVCVHGKMLYAEKTNSS